MKTKIFALIVLTVTCWGQNLGPNEQASPTSSQNAETVNSQSDSNTGRAPETVNVQADPTPETVSPAPTNAENNGVNEDELIDPTPVEDDLSEVDFGVTTAYFHLERLSNLLNAPEDEDYDYFAVDPPSFNRDNREETPQLPSTPENPENDPNRSLASNEKETAISSSTESTSTTGTSTISDQNLENNHQNDPPAANPINGELDDFAQQIIRWAGQLPGINETESIDETPLTSDSPIDTAVLLEQPDVSKTNTSSSEIIQPQELPKQLITLLFDTPSSISENEQDVNQKAPTVLDMLANNFAGFDFPIRQNVRPAETPQTDDENKNRDPNPASNPNVPTTSEQTPNFDLDNQNIPFELIFQTPNVPYDVIFQSPNVPDSVNRIGSNPQENVGVSTGILNSTIIKSTTTDTISTVVGSTTPSHLEINNSSKPDITPVSNPVLIKDPTPTQNTNDQPEEISFLQPPKYESHDYPQRPDYTHDRKDNEKTCGQVTTQIDLVRLAGKTTLDGQWPWQAAIYQAGFGNSYLCSGTLITLRHVITAAHCVHRQRYRRHADWHHQHHHNYQHPYHNHQHPYHSYQQPYHNYQHPYHNDHHSYHNYHQDYHQPRDFMVKLGKRNLYFDSTGCQTRFVRQTIVHPGYGSDTPGLGVAILELDRPVDYTELVRPVCLGSHDADIVNVTGKVGSMPGWGFDAFGLRQELSEMQMKICDQNACAALPTESGVGENTFCGQWEPDTPCLQDSGNGIVIRKDETWYLRGVSTFKCSAPCADSSAFVFSNLLSLESWILENTKEVSPNRDWHRYRPYMHRY